MSVETAGRSVATFEGEQFFTPDDIPDGLDLATSASMQRDQQARRRSVGTFGVPFERQMLDVLSNTHVLSST